MDPQQDDVRSRLDTLHQEQRHLGQSIAASGLALRRVLRATDEATHLTADGLDQTDAAESWPRGLKAPSRFYPRAAVIVTIALIALVLPGVIAQRSRAARQPIRTDIAVEPKPEPKPPPPELISVPQASTGESFVIHVRATRQCLVSIVVDGIRLDWRELKEGDELVSRPAYEILIESNDAGALAATVNGRPVRLGEDGQKIAFRLPPSV